METRPDNLLEALGIGGYEGLTEEERTMKEMLTQHYREQGKTLMREVKAYREEHRDAGLGDAIRVLYSRETAERTTAS